MSLFGNEDLDANIKYFEKLTSKEGLSQLATMINGCLHRLDIRERNLQPLIWEIPEIITALSNVVKLKGFKFRLAFHNNNDNNEKALEAFISEHTRLRNLLAANKKKINNEEIQLLHWNEGFLGTHSIIGDDDYCVVVESHNPATENVKDRSDTCGLVNFTYFNSEEIKRRRDIYDQAIGKKPGTKNKYGICDVMTKYDPSEIIKQLEKKSLCKTVL